MVGQVSVLLGVRMGIASDTGQLGEADPFDRSIGVVGVVVHDGLPLVRDVSSGSGHPSPSIGLESRKMVALG